MVTTRSAGASEPLEVLQTPPRRQRKANKPDIFYDAPEHIDKDLPMTEANQNVPTEASPPTASTSKRRRSEDDSQDENTDPKRARTESSPKKLDPFFMFPKKDLSDDEEELSRSAPPKSYADMIRRDRRLRQLRKKNNPLGLTPRRQLAKVTGQNPFGIETFTQQELNEARSANAGTPIPREHHEREERSAAPEPETPKSRSLFGSLRTLGNATIGRAAQSLFGSLTPRSNINTPEPEARLTATMPSTEPRRTTRSKPVWEIEYPQLPQTPQTEEEELTESDKKRRAYEARYGKVNSDYDHLHTESIDGNPDSLPYPIKKKPPPAPPVREEDMDGKTRAFCQERKKANLERFGLPRPKVLPKIAPLFGPDSHATRRTVDPRWKELKETGVHPADREDAERSRKRKALADAYSSEEQTRTLEQTQSRTFQPYIEDEEDSADISEAGPSTPAAKRQKTTHQLPQTPRSAMKAPGSIGRTGRSVMFNANPVASIKRMTPPTRSPASPAPAGTYDPNNPFKTFADDERDRREGLVQDSPASDMSLDPSPNTRANTIFNANMHPGDALTDAINNANPTKIAYVWRDPTNPDWRPSLANPQPGTFRYVPEDEEDSEEEKLAELERTETAKEAGRTSTTPEVEAPQPPSTPRMSHAELPKPAGLSQNTPAQAAASPSASALEAANLERRRAEAAKTRPKTSSRLAEVTSARSRSPSPPGLDTENVEGSSPVESGAKTPSPVMEEGTWTWTDETNEYIASNPRHPDFAYNPWGELIPSFCMRTASGDYDDTLTGPDGMTEASRQAFYAKKYDDEWAKKEFPFDEPLTYEEAGCGTKYIHDLIRENDARCPELVARADRRFQEEWDAHQKAIEDAAKEGKRLIATFPDRDGVQMHDVDED